MLNHCREISLSLTFISFNVELPIVKSLFCLTIVKDEVQYIAESRRKYDMKISKN